VGFKLITLVVIGTDYIGRYKSNYHTITTMMALEIIMFDFISHTFSPKNKTSKICLADQKHTRNQKIYIFLMHFFVNWSIGYDT
jgi:hypothetical protein